jgi:soluble lytic murein transglycosylase-like protein
MQLNLMHHPDAFTSLDQAFDPYANAAFAARFLNVLYNRTGSWPKSIAAYHSDTPLFADEYQRRVLAMWQEHKATHLSGLTHVDSGLMYGAFGSTGRVYGLILSRR